MILKAEKPKSRISGPRRGSSVLPRTPYSLLFTLPAMLLRSTEYRVQSTRVEKLARVR